jgi:hypothetical protein
MNTPDDLVIGAMRMRFSVCLVGVLSLPGCAGQNMFDIPALKTVDQRRADCHDMFVPSLRWDYTTHQCVQLSPEQAAERQRQSEMVWKEEIKDEYARQADFEKRYPAAAECMRQYAGRFVQSRSGQLMEMCLNATR